MWALFLLSGLLLLTDAAMAQPAPVAPKQETARPPSPAVAMDQLFDRLAKANSEAEARGIAATIQRRWLRSGSDTADLLMNRAVEALTTGDHELAVELLDRVIALEPGWAEAWNKRATVFAIMGDDTRAIADIRETLRREPRHFGALFGLAAMLSARDDKKAAYDIFKRVHAIYPQFAPVRQALERLKPEIEGRDI
jgi:tetratricopeptide (TPR) repeat protein